MDFEHFKYFRALKDRKKITKRWFQSAQTAISLPIPLTSLNNLIKLPSFLVISRNILQIEVDKQTKLISLHSKLLVYCKSLKIKDFDWEGNFKDIIINLITNKFI